MSEAIKEAEKILKQYYGYDHFREGQIPVIKAVLGGRDVLGIMPTGAGKSLCYHRHPRSRRSRGSRCGTKDEGR